MKKKILAVLTVVLCLSIVGGVTAAYFTDRDTAHNVITTGNVKIDIVEKRLVDGKLEDYPEGPVQGVMPGSEASKIVTVKNTGSGDAWVRVRVDKRFEMDRNAPESLPAGEVPENMVGLNLDTQHWTKDGQWYYYRQPLTMGKTTEPLFDTVSFDKQMGNAYQGSKLYVEVSAQAVQSKNNPMPASGNPAEIPGWPNP